RRRSRAPWRAAPSAPASSSEPPSSPSSRSSWPSSSPSRPSSLVQQLVGRIRGGCPRQQGIVPEAGPAKRREVPAGGLSLEHDLREEVADRRRVLEPVPAPAEIDEQPRVLGDRTQHRLVIGRVVVDP